MAQEMALEPPRDSLAARAGNVDTRIPITPLGSQVSVAGVGAAVVSSG